MTTDDAARLERRGLLLNLFGALGMALLGIAFALISRSEAALLDGLYSLVGFAIGVAALKVAALVRRPDDAAYNFGYAAYEPMMNLAKGAMILLISVFALVSALDVLRAGGRPVAAGAVALYALIAAAGCFAIAAVVRSLARRTGSPLLAVDARNWWIDGAISASLAAAFLLALLLRGGRFDRWLPFLDPVAVVLLVVGTLPIPLGILRRNWRQLLGGAPEPERQREIEAAVAACLASEPGLTPHLRILEQGRYTYVHLSLVETGAEDLARRDALRAALLERIPRGRRTVALDVLFTADPGWAASTPGPSASTAPPVPADPPDERGPAGGRR